MDQSEALEVLEKYRVVWEQTKKNEVHDVVLRDGEIATGLFFQLLSYQVMVYIIVGQNCGMIEHCVIIDTRKKDFEVDHLLVKSMQRSNRSSHTLLTMTFEVDATKRLRDRPLLLQAVKAWMLEEFQRFQESPHLCESRIKDLVFWEERQV